MKISVCKIGLIAVSAAVVGVCVGMYLLLKMNASCDEAEKNVLVKKYINNLSSDYANCDGCVDEDDNVYVSDASLR